MVNAPQMASFYRALRPKERVRLLARLVREGDDREVARLHDATPAAHAREYNHAIHILELLVAPFSQSAALCGSVLESASLRLALLESLEATHRLRHLDLGAVWRLVPYPITESERARLLALDYERLTPLAACADYAVDSYLEAETEALRPALAGLLVSEKIESEEEGRAAVLALLEAAVASGELPALTPSPDGPALPWGAFLDWAEPGRHAALYLPSAYVPAVELLGGSIFARWDVRPDGEADVVRARREEIAHTLFTQARLQAEDWPSLQPPTTAAQWQAEQDQVYDRWPWRDPGYRTVARRLAEGASPYLERLAGYHDLLERLQAEEFGGEDPLTTPARALLARALLQAEELTASWDKAASFLGQVGDEEPWPVLPGLDVVGEDLQAELDGIYREQP